MVTSNGQPKPARPLHHYIFAMEQLATMVHVTTVLAATVLATTVLATMIHAAEQVFSAMQVFFTMKVFFTSLLPSAMKVISA